MKTEDVKLKIGVETVHIDVTQGTMLGPILFNGYINYLRQVSSRVISYFDYTGVLTKGKDWMDCQINVNSLFHRLNSWFKAYQLWLETDKMLYIPYGAYVNSLPNNLSIKIIGQVIQNVITHMYLGVICERHLHWNFHMG